MKAAFHIIENCNDTVIIISTSGNIYNFKLSVIIIGVLNPLFGIVTWYDAAFVLAYLLLYVLC